MKTISVATKIKKNNNQNQILKAVNNAMEELADIDFIDVDRRRQNQIELNRAYNILDKLKTRLENKPLEDLHLESNSYNENCYSDDDFLDDEFDD